MTEWRQQQPSYGDIHKQTLAKDTAVMQYYDTSMLGNRDAKSTGGKNMRP